MFLAKSRIRIAFQVAVFHFLLLQCACSPMGWRKNSTLIIEPVPEENQQDRQLEMTRPSVNPGLEVYWNVTAREVRLDRFIRAWAKKAGVDIGRLPGEMKNHFVNANLYDIPIIHGLEVLLEDKGFVLSQRESPVRIYTQQQWEALPPVLVEYPINSPTPELAAEFFRTLFRSMNLAVNISVVENVLMITGSWKDHVDVKKYVDQFGHISFDGKEVPKLKWPETPPDLPFIDFLKGPPVPSGNLGISIAVEIQHVAASTLLEHMQTWVDVDKHGSIRVIPLANILILDFPPGAMEAVQELILYLDDAVWQVFEQE